MKKPKIFIACDTTNLTKIKKIRKKKNQMTNLPIKILVLKNQKRKN